MKKIVSLLAAICVLSLFLAPPAHALALQAVIAKIQSGKVQVIGIGAKKKADIIWEGGVVTKSDAGGTFMFKTTNLPSDCVGDLSDGVSTIQVVVAGCKIQGGGVEKTGQTTSYQSGDDGDLEKGTARGYTDNGDGTITDNATGLMWEKLTDDGSIHDWDDSYDWAQAFAVKIATLNTPSCFAGHCDWRLPNFNELLTLVNWGTFGPAVDPVFHNGTTSFTQGSLYWSSTTHEDPSRAWDVNFFFGFFGSYATADVKSTGAYVRAVRGGP